ncbi:MAG: Flp pilus assembly protein TadG [Gammaproteobacteria bacterium]|jgi:Flp pilus assembly protein TadG
MNVRISLGHQGKQTIKTRDVIAARLRRFGRDESGVMIVLTMLFLVLMMIMGGMAVDFMRFESRRTMLQSVSDRAVLAAADLDQDKVAAEVVIDYFEKAGFGGTIIGEPDVIDTPDYNSVGVNARYEMNSIYLRLLGIDTLSAPAAAKAIAGVANVEVSLVVDISGSMKDPVIPSDGSASTMSKIQALRAASTTFAEIMLTDAHVDNISLSLVPYSEQVSIGSELMAKLPVNVFHDYSDCIEFTNANFGTTGIDMTQTYQQTQQFQFNPVRNNYGNFINGMDMALCPQDDFEQMVPLTQDLDTLKANIAQLKPRSGTAMHLGMKWGLALLDPSMRTPLNGIVDPVFADRPVNYSLNTNPEDTQKVIVLMTDGQNSYSPRLVNSQYNSATEYDRWATKNLFYYLSQIGQVGYHSYYWYKKYTNTTSNFYLQQLCTSAKNNGVIVYSVAVEAPADGIVQLAECASSAAHFFNVSGDELETVFGAIAKQVTELRLSL